MNRRDLADRSHTVDALNTTDAHRQLDPVGGKAMAAQLAPRELSCADPPVEAAFDPYNTGAFKVLAQRPRRRTLDDMRQLDAEIRQLRKPWE